MSEIFNFSAGPSMLPVDVLHQIKSDLYNWNNLKISVMEVGHRTKDFNQIVEDSECNLRELLNIPKFYRVLFCHGGARTQFSSIPMNLVESSSFVVDYIDSGYWSRSAAHEAKKYCSVNVIDVNVILNGMRSVKPIKYWKLSHNNIYVHYCPNETIDGIAIYETPTFNTDTVVIGDFSSTLLSYPLDISKFGLIYAAAQKNLGLSGLTIVIIREDLLNRSHRQIPSTLQYSILSEYRSMFNTPPTFSWYVSNLVFKWIKDQGGLSEMKKRNEVKAKLLYDCIDESAYYQNNISWVNRSYMNIPFHLKDNTLNDYFLRESINAGLYALQGHRSVGGMRASLYNAMPLKGVQTLVEFMKWFMKKYG